MKTRIYPELTALKGLLTEKKMSYAQLSTLTKISISALNNKINGYSSFDSSEVDKLVQVLGISMDSVLVYFFPRMLQNATKSA